MTDYIPGTAIARIEAADGALEVTLRDRQGVLWIKVLKDEESLSEGLKLAAGESLTIRPKEGS